MKKPTWLLKYVFSILLIFLQSAVPAFSIHIGDDPVVRGVLPLSNEDEIEPMVQHPLSQQGSWIWYEASKEEQSAFLFKYFKFHFNSDSYNPEQSYINNDFLIRQWQEADTQGQIVDAPNEARDLAVAVFLRLKRNEIYARNKDTFNDDTLRDFFSSMSWYEYDPAFKVEYLNETELANVREIVRLEKLAKNKDQAVLYPYIPLSADLSDGSRLKANLLLKKLTVKTDYGIMKIPVESISRIEKGAVGKNCIVTTRNGDRISVVDKSVSIPVFTVIGWTDLKLDAVARLDFRQSLPERVRSVSEQAQPIQTVTRDRVDDADLIAHWPMDEGRGTIIRDLSENANHGEFSGLRWGEDAGIHFTGSNDSHIRIPNLPEYNFRRHGQFTVQAWAKPISKGGNPTVVRIGRSAARERAIVDIQHGKWRFVLRDENGGTRSRVYGGPAALNKWVHLAIVWDGRKISGYVNGVSMGQVPLTSIASDDVGIGIGGEPDQYHGNYTFHGSIKDVRIYKRALEAEEIQSMMSENIPNIEKSQTAVSDPDLIAHWPMDEASGSVSWDISGTGKHIDLSGLQWASEGGIWFDGVRGRNLKLEKIPAYELAQYGQFTVTAWARTEMMPSTYGRHPAVISLGQTGESESAVIDLFDNGHWRFVARDARRKPVIIMGSKAVESKWIHLALMWDGDLLTAYEDSRPIGSNPMPDLSRDDVGLGIGGLPDNIWHYNKTFKGAVREVRIYSRALGEDEIRALMK